MFIKESSFLSSLLFYLVITFAGTSSSVWGFSVVTRPFPATDWWTSTRRVVAPNNNVFITSAAAVNSNIIHNVVNPHSGNMLLQQRQSHRETLLLKMSSSSTERVRTTKKGTLVQDRTETKVEEKQKKEELWRVVLHNDEVHTFNYVIRSLTKVIGTLDRKAAFEICVQTHGIGKATITKTWKKQAEQFCLGLQRQGLTVSISPDKDFEGGHSGGGL